MMFILFLLSILFSWLCCLALIPLFRHYCLDKPSSRSSHRLPTPSGGGISFVIIGTFISAFNGYYIPLILLPLALLGLIDDFIGISPIWRYLVQLITSFFLLFSNNSLLIYLDSLPFALLIIYSGFIIFSCTAVINFVNFADGLDGLVSCCFLVLLIVAAINNNIFLWPFVGALLGFLLLNWSPAKIFMGDVGSTFLGGLFFALIINGNSFFDSIGLLLVATPLLADCFVCVIRRFSQGQSIFSPHKLHLYQRLNQSGLTHSQVSLLYLLATSFLAIAYLFFDFRILVLSSSLVVIFGAWCDRRLARPFQDG